MSEITPKANEASGSDAYVPTVKREFALTKYSLSTTSGTTDGKAYSISANAGLKTSSNTAYLLGVNYSVPLPNVTNNIPFPLCFPG